jgi:hypothetical protein
MAVVNKEMMETIRSLTKEVKEQKAQIDTLYRTQETMRSFIFRTLGVDPLAAPSDDSNREIQHMQMNMQMDGVSTETSNPPADSAPADNGPTDCAPADVPHPMQKDGTASMGSEARDNTEQMEMVFGGSEVSGKTGDPARRQDLAEADEGSIIAGMGIDTIGSADNIGGASSAGTNTGTADDGVADSNRDADGNGAADTFGELTSSSAMTDGDGDVIMDHHVSIHGPVRSSDSIPPAPCPSSNTPMDPPATSPAPPVSTPTPPINTPASPIDGIELESIQPGSQSQGELVGYSSSTPSSSEMN